MGGAITENNQRVRRRMREILSETDPQQFEILIGELLIALGFEDVEVTKYSSDGGIDVRANLSVGGVTEVKTAVQVKRWANNVSGKTVRELWGGLGPHERGLIITLSDFTKDAQREGAESDRSPISLIGGESLIDLMIKHEVGVVRRSATILQIDEGALSEQLFGESRKWASHALCGAFLAGFRVRTPQSAWHAPEDLSRASERIRRISRQMCRNRLLPVVVWVRFIGDGTLGRCLGPDTLEASFFPTGVVASTCSPLVVYSVEHRRPHLTHRWRPRRDRVGLNRRHRFTVDPIPLGAAAMQQSNDAEAL